MKKDKVVIFDFDGVIVDSLMAAYNTWKEAGATISVEQYRDQFNGNINHAYAPAPIYGVTANDCVIITDTLGDMKEAAEVNMPSIGVTWGFQKPEVLRQGTPIALVDQPTKIASEVANLFENTK